MGKDRRLTGGLGEKAPLLLSYGLVYLFLGLCVLYPLLCVLSTPRGSDFAKVAASSVWRKAALNTLLECVASTSFSVLVGYLYAYAVVKGRVRFSSFFSFMPILHLMTPPFVGGLSFILLLGRQGFLTHTLLGLDVSLYGFWGLLISQTLCFFPLAYMICSQNLRGQDTRLEKAALSMGASRGKVFFTVTLPQSMPAIVSSFLFIAVSVMSDFGNPMIVGGRFRVLAVEIYAQLTGWANGGTSAVLGIVLVIPSLILFSLQNYLGRKNEKATASIGGRSVQGEGMAPSPVAKVFLWLFCAVVSFSVLAQFLSILAGSFQKIWGVNTSLTLSHVKNLLKYGKEIQNSVVFALLGAALSTMVAVFASYLVHRSSSPLKRVVNVVSLLPSAIPGSLYGLAFSLAASSLHYHNSPVLIVLAIAVGFLPFSYRILSSSLSQIKTSVDDGARSLGAGELRTLGDILMPLMKEGIFSSFVYDFVRGVGTMSAVIFLVSFNTPLASIKILNLAEQGFWGDAAALALLLTLITFLVMGFGRFVLALGGKLGKRSR